MPEFKRISETEMRDLLRGAYARDPEASLLAELARSLCDPAIPTHQSRRFHVHPLYRILGLIVFFLVCVFLFFSFVRP